MAWPVMTISIAFNAASIKNITGATFSNITAYVLRWGYRRGRQRQLQKPEAGTAYLELDNASGIFDPEYSASPYHDGGATTFIGDTLYDGDGLGMRPGRHLYIGAQSGGTIYNLFYGYITRWLPLELEGKREPVVRVEAADMLYWLARGEHPTVNASAGQVGAVIEDILTTNPVNFSSGFINLDAGTETVQSLSTGDHNLIATIQSYAESEEPGIFFVNGDGQFTFHDHLRRLTRERSIVRQFTFDNSPTAQAEGALPFERVQYVRDDTELYNMVTVTRAGGTPQQRVNFTSYTRHGPRSYSRSTRHSADADADRLAQQVLARFRRLIGQHTTLTLNNMAGSDDLWPAILGLTISDQIRVVERLYPRMPLLRTRTIDSWIEGVQVDVDQGTGWRATFQLSPILSDLHWKIGGKGVAFPSSPSANDLYYREDLGLLCYYDGTRWLTVHEYTAQAYLQGTVANSIVFHELRQNQAPWITRVAFGYQVVTTNNGSNYWTLAVSGVAANYGATTAIRSINTSATAANAWANSDAAVGSAPANRARFELAVTPTGSPGLITTIATVYYRLIVT